MVSLHDTYYFDIQAYEFTENDGASFLFSDKYKRWFRTTNTGLDILKLMDGKNTLDEIGNEISKLYEIPKNIVIDDLLKFIKILVNMELVANNDMNLESPKLTTIIKNLYVDITNQCNVKCIYCNKKNYELNIDASYMDEEKLLNIIEKLKKQGRIDKSTAINITGGEPLLHPNMNTLLRTLKEMGMSIVLWTNGTLLDLNLCKKLKFLCNSIVLPLDSSEELENDRLRGQGSFSAVNNAMKVCKEEDIPFFIAITPTIYNLNQIEKTVEYAYDNKSFGCIINDPIFKNEDGKDLSEYFSYETDEYIKIERNILKYGGIKKTWRNNLVKQASNEDYFVVLPNRYRCINAPFGIAPKNSCGAGITELSISCSGIYPCHMLHLKEFKIGDLDSDEISYNEVLTTSLDDCKDCTIKMICLGGCRAKSYYQMNDIRAKSPLCESEKKLVNEVLSAYSNDVEYLFENK